MYINTYIEAILKVGVLKFEVKYTYQSYSGSHELYVVEEIGPTLLDHDWL